jgi:hypothetical protein
MASDKSRRKTDKAKKRAALPPGMSKPHPDGDRRHRDFGASAKAAVRDKLLRNLGELPPLI